MTKTSQNQDQILDELAVMANKWPSAIVSRDAIKEFSGGLISRSTMSNTDKNLKRFKRNGKVFYKVNDLIAWIAEKTIIIDNHKESVDDLLLNQMT